MFISRIRGRFFYGWVVAVTFFLIGSLVYGIRYSYGVFFDSIQGEFALSRAGTSGIYSAYWVLCAVLSLVGGWAVDRYGPKALYLFMGAFTGLSLVLTSRIPTDSSWQLYITYSLLLALGTGPAFAVITATTSRWFYKKRGLAMGISSAGGGVGAFVFAPFAAYLITSVGWRWSFVILGLITGLLIMALSLWLKRDPAEIGALPDGVKANPARTGLPGEEGRAWAAGLSLPQSLKARSFWLFAVSWVFYAFCLHLVLVHLVPHAMDLGFSRDEGARFISVMGAVSIVSRLLMGLAADRMGRKAASLICSLAHVVGLVWLIWAQELWMLYVFAVIYGFAYGGIIGPLSSLVGDVLGVRSIGMIFGALGISWGIGAALGPWLAGRIFDTTGDYTQSFMIGAILIALATVLVSLARPEIRRSE
ncbi:MAG: MFS transporter [Chloroflexota bacterium]